jgi:hypothetical protein
MSKIACAFLLFCVPLVVFSQVKNTEISLQDFRAVSVYANSQTNLQVSNERLPSPVGALLRSFVLPGWGHYYADSKNWNRGLIHLGADLALIGAYTGYSLSANRLENNLTTFANQHAGVDLKTRSRDFLLSVAEFKSLDEYNDYQLRSRNWDKIYEPTASNYWNWDSDQNRRSFVQMDTKVQDHRQQLPAVVSLMVVNRVISGIHAFTKARGMHNNAASMSVTIPSTGHGLLANYRISF